MNPVSTFVGVWKRAGFFRPSARTRAFSAGLLLGLFIFPGGSLSAADFHLTDPRLEMTLFAAAPDIVTPIGAACDARGRLYVIESHTHLAPRDYPGPKHDRIKVFTDADNDGRPERVEVFAEGLMAAMGCAFGPDGALYVLCAAGVWRLEDRDGDGRADSRVKVLTLETKETYPHNQLLSLAFGPDGWLYVGRGNTGGHAWTLRGTDGSAIRGYGDGGNIARCRSDGSQVEEFATGFWNPFGLEFDAAGRLIGVDNDPDARGPNRLVHVVRGGDYGHKHLYGGSGNHPFQAWNGELPGTLPYVSGTGEAPCLALDAQRAALPADFADRLLVSVWSEHTIELHTPRARGVSFTAERGVLLRGPEDFRPVSLTPDARGNIYITDWVRVDYPNHGQGRIWRLRAKSGVAVRAARPATAPLEADAGSRAMEKLLTAGPGDLPELKSALRGDDPFLRHAAVMALAQTNLLGHAGRLAQSPDARLRLGALLALRRGGTTDRESIVRRFLADPNEEIRLAAVVWAGDEALTAVRADLDRALAPGVSPTLFEAWLAAVACMEADYARARHQPERGPARLLQRRLPEGFIEQLLADESRPARLRALAVARDPESVLQIEAIRSLARYGGLETPPVLVALAGETHQPASVRAEALVALEAQPPPSPAALLALLDDPNPVVAAASAASLRRFSANLEVKAALLARRKSLPAAAPAAWRETLDAVLGETRGRPESVEDWQRVLATGGDARAGERVFFSARSACSECHTHHGRGGQVGPDLSGIGQSAPRKKIIQSILRPSEEFAPQWQAWIIETKDGETHEGLQLHPKSGGAYDLLTRAGRFERFAGKDIVGVRAATTSLMPAGLEGALTVSEMRDLVAFLAAPEENPSQPQQNNHSNRTP